MIVYKICSEMRWVLASHVGPLDYSDWRLPFAVCREVLDFLSQGLSINNLVGLLYSVVQKNIPLLPGAASPAACLGVSR